MTTWSWKRPAQFRRPTRSHSCCQVAPSGARHTLSETLSKTAPAPSAKAETKLSLGSGRPLTDFQKSRHRPRIGDRKSGKKKGRSRQGRATARMFRDPPAIHWLLRNPKGSLSQHIRRFALPTARRPSYRSHDRLDHYASYWRADVETLNQFIHSLLARRPDSGIPAICVSPSGAEEPQRTTRLDLIARGGQFLSLNGRDQNVVSIINPPQTAALRCNHSNESLRSP